jgi:hypothetical protein
MPTTHYIWKVGLRPNFLTKDKSNDYVAEVSTLGNTARNEDVVQAIIDEGSEIKSDTLLSVIRKADRIKRTFILQGRSVQDGVVHIIPRVYGHWDGANAKFDEEVNSVGIEVTASHEMKDLLKLVKVESLGAKVETNVVYPVLKRLSQNDPKKLIARTPIMSAGKYMLTIVTRFSKGKQLLQTSRTIEYKEVLEAVISEVTTPEDTTQKLIVKMVKN